MGKKKSNFPTGGGGYIAIPRAVMIQKKFRQLGPYARMLLQEMLYDYKGRNNGDLSATWSRMRDRGFRSRSTLHKAKEELLSSGHIVQTRTGGRNKCALYAVAWLAIDECVHPRTQMLKFDGGIKPGVASKTWKDGVVP